MTGLNKFLDKERRRQRQRNHIARDLASSKYHQRVVPDKRKNFIADRFYEEEIESHDQE
jgi:hypothetical protein